MRKIVYNSDNLKESDINEIVVRVKALLINHNNLLIGNESNIYQFVGGHKEVGETLEESLICEISEETGIEVLRKEISVPFMKITYMNKDYPSIGSNRKSDIYYFVVKTNKNIDKDKIRLTNHEIENDYKIEKIPLLESIDIIKKNIPNHKNNEVISRDMIIVIEEYLKNPN